MGLDQKADDLCPLHRRRFLTASAALGAAVLIPGGVHAADVRDLAGSVKVNGKPATRKTRVRPGDVVETGPKSKVVFVIGQDAFLLREQSRLNLDKSKAGKEAVISGLRLVTGALLAVFGKGLRTIETATANAGIRGTGVYIEATPTETYFCTCYGEVELRDKARTVRKLVVSGYHTPNMIFAQMVGGKMMAPAEVKNHTDSELIMLEKLVGRTSPIVEAMNFFQSSGTIARSIPALIACGQCQLVQPGTCPMAFQSLTTRPSKPSRCLSTSVSRWRSPCILPQRLPAAVSVKLE